MIKSDRKESQKGERTGARKSSHSSGGNLNCTGDNNCPIHFSKRSTKRGTAGHMKMIRSKAATVNRRAAAGLAMVEPSTDRIGKFELTDFKTNFGWRYSISKDGEEMPIAAFNQRGHADFFLAFLDAQERNPNLDLWLAPADELK